jgi:hypothetical protein
MGPNALPVPDANIGIIDTSRQFSAAIDSHFSMGDKTQNFFSSVFFPLAKGKAGIKFSIVPIEYFSMDTITRDLRRARNLNGNGFSIGDLYVSTHIQLIKDRQYWPDLLLTINMKTASGNQLEMARFTDTPGYFFDLSFSKKISTPNRIVNEFRPFLMGGFYAYQTTDNKYLQNDAFLFAFGINSQIVNKIEITNSIAGYIGYLEIGDKPIVFRTIIKTIKYKKLNYQLNFQYGINDFPYTSVRAGLLYNF